MTYRVVGVRTDKTRAILAKGLTKDRADAVAKSFANSPAFSEVRVERESDGQSEQAGQSCESPP
jgi:hypothetical protein